MGNWCTMTHWFECEQPGDARAVLAALRTAGKNHRWIDPERWALRAGMVSPTLVQAQSVTKWGADVSLGELGRAVGNVRVAQLCLDEDLLFGPTQGPGFHLGCNYVVSPAAHHLPGVAEMLGGGAVSVDAGERRILCMPAPAPLYLADGRLGEVVERDDPLARLIDALVSADRHGPGGASRHLLGLYTPAHGWVHQATLVLDLPDQDWEHTGEVSLEDGADHNAVIYEFTDGPFARSIYVPDTKPVTLTRQRWPLAT
jgi:hypothetical protein